MRIFFVSDIHGSVKCFRKLVNAGKFYGADLVIMGGDLAGKQLIPVVAQGGVSRAHYNGADFTFETTQEIADFERRDAELGAVIEAPLEGTPAVGTELFLRAVGIFHVARGLVQHESSWYGDGWLRQRLGRGGAPPPPLPVTPSLAVNGARFR